MQFIYFFILVIVAQQAFAQEEVLREERPIVVFFEVGGGMAGPMNRPQYSINSSLLNNDKRPGSDSYWSLRGGLRLQKRHYVALGVERTPVSNLFAYDRGDDINAISYDVGTRYHYIHAHYAFDLLPSPKFMLAPLVQVGLGIADDISWWELEPITFTTIDPNTGMDVQHVATVTFKEQRPVVFTYAAGMTFEWNIWDDRISLGAELKVLHSPYSNGIMTHSVAYDYGNEPTLNFDVSTTILNLHLGARLRYYF